MCYLLVNEQLWPIVVKALGLGKSVFLHRIKRQDSAICPHCHSADETVEHLVFQCPAHDHARRDTWPGDTFTTDTRRLWSYLEWIGAVTPPPTGNEREREREEIYLQYMKKPMPARRPTETMTPTAMPAVAPVELCCTCPTAQQFTQHSNIQQHTSNSLSMSTEMAIQRTW